MFWTLHKWNSFGSALPWKLGDTSIYLWMTVDPKTTSLLPHSIMAPSVDGMEKRLLFCGDRLKHSWRNEPLISWKKSLNFDVSE